MRIGEIIGSSAPSSRAKGLRGEDTPDPASLGSAWVRWIGGLAPCALERAAARPLNELMVDPGHSGSWGTRAAPVESGTPMARRAISRSPRRVLDQCVMRHSICCKRVSVWRAAAVSSAVKYPRRSETSRMATTSWALPLAIRQ